MSPRAARRVRIEISPASAVALVLAAALAVLLWDLRHVVLLVFGAIIVSIGLNALGGRLRRLMPMNPRLAVLLVILLAALGLAAALGMGGIYLLREAREFAARLPDALTAFNNATGLDWREVTERAGEQVGRLSGGLISGAATFAGALANGLAGTLVVLVAGSFIAFDPAAYQLALLRALPKARRVPARRLLEKCGEGLRSWLAGQLLSMLIVGLLTAIGLIIVGTPSAMLLGLINGLAELVPIVGPWIGAIPALLIAYGQDSSTLAGTALVLLIVQQLESNLIMPLVMRRMVELQPAIVLFSVIGFGVLFGVAGVVFAMPLAIVASIVLKELSGEEEAAQTAA